MASESFVGNGHGYAVSTWHAKDKKVDFLVLKQILNQEAGDAREASTGQCAANLPGLAVIGSLVT
jgi:hypothetical protein